MPAPESVPTDRRRRGSVTTLLCGVLITVVVVAAASSADEPLWSADDDAPSEVVEREAPPEVVMMPSPNSTESTTWFPAAGSVLVFLAALMSAAVVVIAMVTLIRGTVDGSWTSEFRRGRGSSSTTSEPQVPRGVEADDAAVLSAIREGSPRNAIVRCWMLLEQAATAAGMRRQPAETSSEYVERVIGTSSVDAGPIADLGALFREARFSSRPVEEASRAKAELALGRTLDSLRRPSEQQS